MSNQLDYYKHLASIMLTTRGTRFTAAQILKNRERFSVLTLAFLSVFLIAVSVFSLAIPNALGSFGGKYFGTLSAVASIAILVITLSDNSLERGILAHRLQQNALRISKVMRKMERELEKITPDINTLESLACEYEDGVADTEVNHSTSHYKIYVYSRQKANGRIIGVAYAIRNILYISLVFFRESWPNLLVITAVLGATLWYFLH
jgi:hypothetical protein